MSETDIVVIARHPAEMQMSVGLDELRTRFTYHRPKGDQPARYHAIREEALVLAEIIVKNTPESREQSLALTQLEQAVMWANAGIARRET